MSVRGASVEFRFPKCRCGGGFFWGVTLEGKNPAAEACEMGISHEQKSCTSGAAISGLNRRWA